MQPNHCQTPVLTWNEKKSCGFRHGMPDILHNDVIFFLQVLCLRQNGRTKAKYAKIKEEGESGPQVATFDEARWEIYICGSGAVK